MTDGSAVSLLDRLDSNHLEMGLGRITAALDAMDLRTESPVITVGGTNGKGSTCAMLESILGAAAGYHFGCYTSPHLLDVTERNARRRTHLSLNGRSQMKPVHADEVLEKSAIRRALLSRRNSFPVEIRLEYSQAALARVTATAVYTAARFVMAYCSFGSEIETLPILHTALRDGKELVLPKINRTTNSLDLYIVKDLLNDLVPGLWGIREPNADLCARLRPKDLDLIVTPGIAFDKSGGRVGYGRGYYDRLLQACHAAGKRPFAVAAAFELQIVDALPMERHDVHIDAIATENDYYKCDGRGQT